jgi:hypothetical protein
MPSKPVAKKPIPGKPQAIKPAQKNVVQKKPAPDKLKDLRLLKEKLKTSPVQKKPAPDKVENLAIEYLAELREADVTFEKGTAVLEKYRAKYPELASYIREIAPGERRIEIRQRLEGEDINLHLFAIRVLEDEARYEVKLSGDAEHRTVKPSEWLSLLQDKLEIGKAGLGHKRAGGVIPSVIQVAALDPFLDRNPLYLVERDFISPPVVQLRRPGRFMIGGMLRHFSLPLFLRYAVMPVARKV